MNLHDLSRPSDGDHFTKKSRAKPGPKSKGGRPKGALSKTTIERNIRAEIAAAERKGQKLAKEHAQAALDFFASLMAGLMPYVTEKDPASGQAVLLPRMLKRRERDAEGNMRTVEYPAGSAEWERFMSVADMVHKLSASLMPFQSPRLSAIAIAPEMPSGPQKTIVTIDIFDDKGAQVGHVVDGESRALVPIEARP